MTITLEQVEKLREKANVSFEEAKRALEQTDGDLLEALILLEHEGKTAPVWGGSYSTNSQGAGYNRADNRAKHAEGCKNFFGAIGRFLTSVITVGGENYLDIYRNGQLVLSISVLAFVLLLLVGFWCILPLMLIGLFFKFSYQIRGKELGNDKVNEVLGKTADAFQKAVEV